MDDPHGRLVVFIILSYDKLKSNFRWLASYAATVRALLLSPRDPFAAIYFGIAAYAQFVGRNYEEAMRLASVSIRPRGDHVGGHRGLTISAAMAGKADIATAALKELLRAQPNFSLAWIATNMPFKTNGLVQPGAPKGLDITFAVGVALVDASQPRHGAEKVSVGCLWTRVPHLGLTLKRSRNAPQSRTAPT